MEKNQMKNLVVLKNLPSNLIDEAFVVFKTNKMAKSFKYTEQKEKQKIKKEYEENYMVKEAEMIISDYINSTKVNNKKANKGIILLKIYSLLITVAFITACALM